jgi:16S rRNA (guanine527-N7)-methyltransferase
MSSTGELEVAGRNVSRETLQQLREFEALVRRWNPAINLVSKASLPVLWERHIVDSAQLLDYCPQGAKHWVDLGAGGGFPGLVVAILAREAKADLRVTLVEADARKATFLRQAAQALGLTVSVVNERIESLRNLEADVVSARALASLPELLGFAAQHLQKGGVAIFPKGARHSEELASAQREWNFDVETHPSLSESGAAILIIRNIERAKQN